MSTGDPVDRTDLERRFALVLDRLAGFGPRPHVAVALSGGADSMALMLLADGWARRQGGGAIGLTVDHRLRPESADEARLVGAWLAALDIPHRILVWPGEKPQAGLQAAARTERYRLLEEECQAAGVLHLLLAHHAGDQAETLALRLEAGSGPSGLAGMAAIVERPGCRLLRPLLAFNRLELRRYLQVRRQDWIEDPSNRDPRFARVRVRQALAQDPARQAALLAAAAGYGQQRHDRDRAVARLLARAVLAQGDRDITLDRVLLTAAPVDIGRQALVRCLMHVGGQPYVPRQARLERLWQRVRAGPLERTVTLAGCLLRPVRRQQADAGAGADALRLVRETARQRAEPLEGGGALPHLNNSRMRLGLPVAGAISSYPATHSLAGADFAVAEPAPSVIS